MSMASKEKNKLDDLRFDEKRLINSFKYAFSGIVQAYIGEQNLKIHTLMAIVVIVGGVIFKISYIEWLVCLILIGLVLMAEFFNTALEYVVDLVSPGIHPLAKAAKDTASAGVLVFAIISALIGTIIFLPKIVVLIGELL